MFYCLGVHRRFYLKSGALWPFMAQMMWPLSEKFAHHWFQPFYDDLPCIVELYAENLPQSLQSCVGPILVANIWWSIRVFARRCKVKLLPQENTNRSLFTIDKRCSVIFWRPSSLRKIRHRTAPKSSTNCTSYSLVSGHGVAPCSRTSWLTTGKFFLSCKYFTLDCETVKMCRSTSVQGGVQQVVE